MGMKTSEQIRAAAALLTEDNWHQGSYFGAKGSTLCMCAHGALQCVVNERIRRLLRMSATVPARSACSAAVSSSASPSASWGAAVAVAVAKESSGMAGALRGAIEVGSMWSGRRRRPEASALLLAYSRRPYWAHPAHFILGMVGLTASWNDMKGRTFDEVKAKFEEAAKLAELIEGAEAQ